jgi:hypothetical protein
VGASTAGGEATVGATHEYGMSARGKAASNNAALALYRSSYGTVFIAQQHAGTFEGVMT